MNATISEQLTSQFYQWEILGRGRLLCDNPVHLEAPFTPFFGHFPWKEQPYNDDGIRHNVFSGIAAAFKKPKQESAAYAPEISYNGYLFDVDEERIAFKISIPKDSKLPAANMEQLLLMLSYCLKPISFELIGNSKTLTFQVVCRDSDSAYIETQLHSYFPLLIITKADDAFGSFATYDAFTTVDYTLEQEFTRPLGTKHAIDSLTGLISVLETIQPNETAMVQVLFNGLCNKWEQSIMRAVSDGDNGCFFDDAPEMLQLAKQKTAKPLLAVCIRAVAFADDMATSEETVRKLNFAIERTHASSSNSLVHNTDSLYNVDQRIYDIYFRTSHRLGMLLNIEELAAIIHIPSPDIASKFSRSIRQTKVVPSIAKNHPFVIGINEHNGIEKEVTLSTEHRIRHTYVLGATGTGKSTLLSSMIVQDIELGNGLAVLDPHGDLIESILNCIPENRIKDIVLIDPSDAEYPVGFNVLQAHTEIEKQTLASDLAAAFKRLSTSWGDQMHSVLSNAILAFLESAKGGTLLDLRRFLLEPAFRNAFLKTINDYNVQYYWQKQYPLLKNGSVGPIVTRLDTFLRSKLIRNMVAQERSIDFDRVLNTKKILLVKLSQGLIGEENSYLLGTFIVSKIHQAALARQISNVRIPFFLYIDEFQHFVTPSMSHILSGARKYQLGLILAHQDMQQLSRYDADLSNAILSNAVTRICFRLSEQDAKKMADGCSHFEAHDFQNLSVGEAIARIEKPEWDFSLSISDTSALSTQSKEKVLWHTRSTYATPKHTVEEALFASFADTRHEEQKVVPKEKVKPDVPTEAITVPIATAKVPAIAIETNTMDVAEQIMRKKTESQHRYLQNLIKRIAESRDYKAVLEVPLPTKDGKIDVVISSNTENIACEVCVTTDTDWELHNLQKCLDAGYVRIISCSAEPKMRANIQRAIEQTFSKSEQAKIIVLEPEGILTYLDSLHTGTVKKEKTYKGYRVQVLHQQTSVDDQHRKRDGIAQIVAESLRRINKTQAPK